MTPETPSELPAPRKGRAVRLVAGWALLVTGTALLVLPGPGIPLVLGGLAILGREQAWAGRLHRRILDGWARARDRRFTRRVESAPPANGDR